MEKKKPSLIESMLRGVDVLRATFSAIDDELVGIRACEKQAVPADKLDGPEKLADRAVADFRMKPESHQGASRRLAAHIHHGSATSDQISAALAKSMFGTSGEGRLYTLLRNAEAYARQHGLPRLYGSPKQVAHAEIRRHLYISAAGHPFADSIAALAGARLAETWISVAGYAAVDYRTFPPSKLPLLFNTSGAKLDPTIAKKVRLRVDALMVSDRERSAVEVELETLGVECVETEFKLPELKDGGSKDQLSLARRLRALQVLRARSGTAFARLTSPSSVIDRALQARR